MGDGGEMTFKKRLADLEKKMCVGEDPGAKVIIISYVDARAGAVQDDSPIVHYSSRGDGQKQEWHRAEGEA